MVCQTSAVFHPFGRERALPTAVANTDEICRIDLRTANASSFLVTDGVVPGESDKISTSVGTLHGGTAFLFADLLSRRITFPDVVFRFLSNVLVVHSQLIVMSPEALLPSQCSPDKWHSCLLSPLVIPATP